MRFAYADPPYLGCCSYYGHRHEEPYGCWDDPETHESLLLRLDREYDGWAYSLSSPSLDELVPVKPAGSRTGAWIKPFAAFKRNIRVAYTWEPVFFKPGRDSSKDGAPVGRDHLDLSGMNPPETYDYLACSITLRRGLTGAKPERFCEWIRNLLGWMPGDEMDDLFPGTGVMDAVMAQEVML